MAIGGTRYVYGTTLALPSVAPIAKAEVLGLHTRLRLGELSLGYQVERSTRSSSFYHELLLGYTLPHGRTKHTEPRYKSIRLL